MLCIHHPPPPPKNSWHFEFEKQHKLFIDGTSGQFRPICSNTHPGHKMYFAYTKTCFSQTTWEKDVKEHDADDSVTVPWLQYP